MTRGKGQRSNRKRGGDDADREPPQRRERKRDSGESVEGFHAVRELLRADRRTVREVWIVADSAGAEEIAALARDRGVPVRPVTAMQLEAEARSEAPQGLLARAAPVPEATAGDLLRAPDAFIVALDGVTDPGNLGAVLRTAETAGATGIVLTRQRAAGLGPTALKAAAGALEYLPVAFVAGIPSFLDDARRAQVWTVGLDGGGDTDVDALTVADGPVVIVLGAEGRGLARLTRERCDVVASIPLHGRLESLNVAAAAAIALHAVARRRHAR